MAHGNPTARYWLLFAAALSAAVARPALAGSEAASMNATDGPQAQASVPQEPPPAAQRSPGRAAPIIVAPGPRGVVIASDDIPALEEFEQLLKALAGGQATGRGDLMVHYLRHAKAAAVAETLDAVFAGQTLSPGEQRGEAPPGSPDAARSDFPGGPPDNSPRRETIRRSSGVRITPDPRLNALIVQASPSEAETIQELLKILDQAQAPEEVAARAKPRIVAVHNTRAQDVADVVRQVYQDRLSTAAGRGGAPPAGPFPQPFGGPPGSPQDFVQQVAMLGRGMGQGGRGPAEETQKLSIGVDARTNSLVIVAPDPLFQEVKDLVAQLDRVQRRSEDSLQAVTLRRTNVAVLRRALPALMGDRVKIGQIASAGPQPGVAGVPPAGWAPPTQPFRDLPALEGLAPDAMLPLEALPALPGAMPFAPGPAAPQPVQSSPGEPGPPGTPFGPTGGPGTEMGPAGPTPADLPQGPPMGPFPQQPGDPAGDPPFPMDVRRSTRPWSFPGGSRGQPGVSTPLSPDGFGAPPR